MEKLVVSCGGTGGHFFPGLSIARTFAGQGKKVILLLSGVHAEEQKEIAGSFGIEAVALPPMPHYRRHPLRFIAGFFRGYRMSVKVLKEFQPEAMLGMGSFAALPTVRAALKCKIPLFLHDGNARIGKANRFFSKKAKFTATAFPAVNAAACRSEVIETGMPLRPELPESAGITKADAINEVNREFGTEFSAELPLILITGGSQGAAVFNETIPQALRDVDGKFQVIHLTGKGKLEAAQELYRQAAFPVLLRESTGKMAQLLAAADLVFSRSGGSTTAEIALFGKPAVLIPYPYAAEGHQMDNARHFGKHGAALVVENSAFTPDKAREIIAGFLQDPEKFRQMGGKMRELARPQASEELISKISAAVD